MSDEDDESGMEKGHTKEFLETLGRALVSWQYVEMNLFLTFNALIRGRDHHLVSAAYYAVPGLGGQVAMIDAAAQLAVVGTPLENEWRVLCAKVRERIADRNVLAHFGTLGFIPAEGKPSLRLARSIFDVRLKGNKNEYSLDDIRRFENSFAELTNSIVEFRDRLVAFLSASL